MSKYQSKAASELNKETFNMRNLTCASVVVFADRVEVKRLLRTRLKRGESELLITGITNSIEMKSVRVEGRSDAMVLDVVCQAKQVKLKESDTTEAVQVSRLEIVKQKDKIEDLEQKHQRIIKQSDVLNEFAKTLSKPNATSGQRSAFEEISLAENVNNFLGFMDSYSKAMETLDNERRGIKKQIAEAEQQFTEAKKNLENLNFDRNNNETI